MTDSPKTMYELELDRIAEANSPREHQYAQLRQSKAFMEKNYTETIELEKIAAAAAMSRFHYIRMFQRVYGLTPRQFLRDLRILKAKELLAMGLPVTTVCYDVGYGSLPTFSSAFKRGTGYSPKDFQRMKKSNRE